MSSVLRSTICAISLATALALGRPTLARAADEAPSSCAMQYAFLNLRLRFNLFMSSRTLGEYKDYLPREFRSLLDQLGPDSHWLDSGAGKAVALQEYLERARNPANATGVVLSGKRPKNASEKLRYLSGRPIEDIPSSELGRADLITDFYGPGSYSTRVSEVINKYIEVLNPGGKAFVLLTPEGKVNGDSGLISLLRYLLEQRTPPWLEFSYEGQFLIIRKKAEGEFKIPELKIESLESRSPPIRIFRPAEKTGS